MAHYGSEVIDWFNEHLTHLIEDGTYETLCEQAQEKHSKLTCFFWRDIFSLRCNLELRAYI